MSALRLIQVLVLTAMVSLVTVNAAEEYWARHFLSQPACSTDSECEGAQQ